ncbi:MAG: SDR family NAD(P)-dependent oxidoreductase [Actinomycetota bacterium]|nr:SDR family NAD(P)-dependent oxidoreductase [Actinomycetota bacterium]
MEFDEKVIAITGGGTGIGRAIATGFAKEGAKVIISGRREKPLKEIKSLIEKINKNIEYMQADVSDSAMVDNFINKAIKLYGSLDVFINNAAVSIGKSIVDTTDEDLDYVLSVNLKGYFYGMRSAIKKFIELNKKGVIINISSILGLKGHLYRGAYCASKAAINNLTRCAAMEYADKNIRINAICPGVIETDMVKTQWDSPPDPVKEMLKGIPMNRMGSCDEVAKLVLFLSSESSSYITGSVITVDGGWSAGK